MNHLRDLHWMLKPLPVFLSTPPPETAFLTNHLRKERWLTFTVQHTWEEKFLSFHPSIESAVDLPASSTKQVK